MENESVCVYMCNQHYLLRKHKPVLNRYCFAWTTTSKNTTLHYLLFPLLIQTRRHKEAKKALAITVQRLPAEKNDRSIHTHPDPLSTQTFAKRQNTHYSTIIWTYLTMPVSSYLSCPPSRYLCTVPKPNLYTFLTYTNSSDPLWSWCSRCKNTVCLGIIIKKKKNQVTSI